jgi:hypothetical protein
VVLVEMMEVSVEETLEAIFNFAEVVMVFLDPEFHLIA